jgi:hypothetical protein
MAVSTEDALAVEQTVRGYFADNGLDPLELSAGPLRDVESLLRELDPQPERMGLELQRLAATAVGSDAAEVDLFAVAQFERRENGHRRRWVTRYSGPVRLRRVDDNWKIVDYRVDGRSIVDSFHAVAPESLERDGVVFRPRGLLLHRRVTVAYFEVENRRETEIDLRAASTSLCYCRLEPARVFPGQRVIARVAWSKRMPLRRTRVRGSVYARDRAAKLPFDFGWWIDRRAREGAVTPRVRRSVMLRLYSLFGDTGFLVGLAALPPALVWAILGFRSAHGILPYSAGAFVFGAISAVFRRRHMRAAAFTLAAVGCLALWNLSGG